MIKTILLIITTLISFVINGQEIAGRWNGLLKLQGKELRFVFNISKTQNGLSATMDSPDERTFGIQVTAITFENSVLKLEIKNSGIKYEGTLHPDETITGFFKQNEQNLALDLSHYKVKKEIVVKYQEPQKPYPYYTEDITFENKTDNIILEATLSLPKKEGNFPVVILIPGYNKRSRDMDFVGHKHFLVLRDYLTKKGIGVLQYDDRGAGKSTGNYSKATIADLAKDVEAGVEYLKTRKEINKNKIGLLGHSEGGIIAAIVAGNSNDINYIVSLAASGVRGDKNMLQLRELILCNTSIPEIEIYKGQEELRGAYNIILNAASNDESLKKEIKSYFKATMGYGATDEDINESSKALLPPWMYYFLRFDPSTAFRKVKCPVLALNGDKDMHLFPEGNLIAIKEAVLSGGNKKVTTKNLPGLNHFFQETPTGSPSEYSEIAQTFSPIALEEISRWILLQTK